MHEASALVLPIGKDVRHCPCVQGVGGLTLAGQSARARSRSRFGDCASGSFKARAGVAIRAQRGRMGVSGRPQAASRLRSRPDVERCSCRRGSAAGHDRSDEAYEDHGEAVFDEVVRGV